MEEELLYRQPPHSPEAEYSVLGSMLVNSHCIPQVIEALKAEDFYLEQNQLFFRTIHTMFSHAKVIDPVTALEQLRLNSDLDEAASRNYVMQLLDVTPTAANVTEYIEIVRDFSLMRRVAQAMEEKGASVEYIACSGDPDSLDAVVFPALNTAIVDGTAPHG